MLYIWHVTVTAGTVQTAPAEEKVKVRTGVITKIEVKFPRGCHGLVYATVSHRLTQLLPFNAKGGAAADDETVSGEYFWELKKGQTELALRCWSPDATYDHTITFRINILPRKVATMIPVIDLLTKLLRRMGVVG